MMGERNIVREYYELAIAPIVIALVNLLDNVMPHLRYRTDDDTVPPKLLKRWHSETLLKLREGLLTLRQVNFANGSLLI